MEPSEHRLRQIILQRIGHCRVCHRKHEGGDVNLVSQKSEFWTLMVECPDCHARSFVAAVVDEKRTDEARNALEELAVELSIRDISEAPTNPTLSAAALSDDDVAEMRGFLEGFNGDFKRLFNARG